MHVVHYHSLFYCSMFLSDFIKSHSNAELQFEQLPFNHPLFIMFSSGTTGTPKCMVHTAGVSELAHMFLTMTLCRAVNTVR